MTVAVIGSRSFNDYQHMCEVLRLVKPTHIVSGGAYGADRMAVRYARENSIAFTEIRPNYPEFGKRAPLIRNKLIVDKAQFVVAFWNGTSPGTRHALKYAVETGKRYRIERFNEIKPQQQWTINL